MLDSQSENEGKLRINLISLIHTHAVALAACAVTHSFICINSRSKLGLHQDLLWPSKKPAIPPFGIFKNARDSKYRPFASVLDTSLGRERKRVEVGMSTSAPAIIPSNDGGQRDTLLPDISAKLTRIHFSILSLHHFLAYIMYLKDKRLLHTQICPGTL